MSKALRRVRTRGRGRQKGLIKKSRAGMDEYIYISSSYRHGSPATGFNLATRGRRGEAQSKEGEEEEGSGHLSLSGRLTTVSLPARLSASD